MNDLASWWQDVLDDLEPDTATVTITMSRSMIERTRRFLALTETGQRIEWCETHDAQQDREDRSGFGCDWADGKTECRIVSKFLTAVVP